MTPLQAALAQDKIYTTTGKMDRYASLKEGYEMRLVPEVGTGLYPVNVETGEVCEFNGEWFLEGRVLLCRDCFEEGT